MTKTRQKSAESKINSTLAKDINRIRKTAEAQIKINTLRKYQITLLNDFLKKLLAEKRITKNELMPYMPKKKDAEKKLFEKNKNLSQKF